MNRCHRTEATAIPHSLDDTNNNSTTETATLNAIAAVLSGNEWSPETLEAIADLVRASGRTVAEHDACDGEAPYNLDDEVLRRIRSGALPSEDVEILPCPPTRGADDGWWVEVRVWVPDSERG